MGGVTYARKAVRNVRDDAWLKYRSYSFVLDVSATRDRL